MADNDVREVSPEELAALDDLGRLLEQYQTYLIAGHAFADAARAQASNASGTARPSLERLLSIGLGGVPRLEAALRIPRSEEDRKTILDDVEPALKDLRALMATARRYRHVPLPAGVASPTVVSPAMPIAALAPHAASAGGAAAAATRSRMLMWVGGALMVGLILGAFGTELPRTAGFLSRLVILLEPVVAAASGGILGELLLREGLMDTLRKRWPTMLVCSILLVATAPTAVDAALELVARPPGQASPSAPSAASAPSATTAPSPPSVQPPAPGPAEKTMPPERAQSPVSNPGPLSSTAGPTPAAGNPAAKSSPSLPTLAAGSQAQRPSAPAVTAGSPSASSAECAQLRERFALGGLTDQEMRILRDCRK